MRKLDDKPLLVEIHLIESRLYYDLRNFPRSRAALTAARTAAGAIYCPPALQAAIDMQAGIINSQEKDFRTGFSYFVEAFDAFQNFDTPNAVLALKCVRCLPQCIFVISYADTCSCARSCRLPRKKLALSSTVRPAAAVTALPHTQLGGEEDISGCV